MSDLFVSLLVVVMTLFGFACGVVWAARRMITRHTPEWTAKCKEIQDALNAEVNGE